MLILSISSKFKRKKFQVCYLIGKLLKDYKIGQKSDVFLPGKATVDIASLFTAIMMKAVHFFFFI